MSRAAASPLLPLPMESLLTRLADALPWPLFVLRPDACLAHANLAGRELLARATPLRCDAAGRVSPQSTAQRAAFEEALSLASTGQTVPLRWPGRPQARHGLLRALPGDGAEPLLLLAVAALEGTEFGGLASPPM